MPALVSAEKEQFAVSLLQWYRNALYKNEESAFFDSTRILFFDRFPPPPGDPMSAQYHLEVDAELANFTLVVMLYGCLPDYRDTLPSIDDWRLHITLPADRQRRRDEWLIKGSGQPIEHQYVVAFEDENEFEEQYTDLEGHIYC